MPHTIKPGMVGFVYFGFYVMQMSDDRFNNG
jgi:hypothetical protein